MAKLLKDVLRGSNAAKTGKLSVGRDPGVDYAPKAPDDQKFVAKHTVTKHDPVGHDDAVFDGSSVKRRPNSVTNKGYDHGEDEAAYGVQ